MKKLLKILLILILVIVAALAALLGWLTATEFNPAPVEAAAITRAGDNDTLHGGDRLTVLSWNIGFGGLGKAEDSFLDGGTKAKPDSVSLSVCRGDIILLCSDGLSGVLRDRKSYDRDGALLPGKNLEDIIRANRSSMTACRTALWEAAEAAEWYDNVTAILCEITEGPEASSPHKTIESEPVRRRPWKTLGIVLGILALCCGLLFLGKHYLGSGQKVEEPETVCPAPAEEPSGSPEQQATPPEPVLTEV